MEPLDRSLKDLYYLYWNFSKSHQELKSLDKEIKKEYQMQVQVNVTEVDWLKNLIYVFAILKRTKVQHPNPQTSQNIKERLQNWLGTKMLLRYAFFTDVSAETNDFSMITQEESINIIKMLDAAEIL